VGDDRALERNDRTTLVEGRPDFFMDQHLRPTIDKGALTPFTKARPPSPPAGNWTDRR
jgi:hypothetical protein